MTTWHLPVATMARVDDTTARLIAGTIATYDPHIRTEVIPEGSASMVLTVEQYRRTYGRQVAA